MVRTSLGAQFTANVDVRGAESVVTVTADSTSNIPAGGELVDIVRPPTGFIYELISLRFVAQPPSGSTTGVHRVTVRPEGAFMFSLLAESNHNDRLALGASAIQQGTSRQSPSSPSAQVQALRGLRAGPATGFKLLYKNATDAAQANTRQVRLWLRRIEVEA